MTENTKPPPKRNIVVRFFSNLGPGLITGAADDDPSGCSDIFYCRRTARDFAPVDGFYHMAIDGLCAVYVRAEKSVASGLQPSITYLPKNPLELGERPELNV
jgi:hypothetical protein